MRQGPFGEALRGGPKNEIDEDGYAGRYANEEPDIKNTACREFAARHGAEQVERIGRDQGDNPGDRLELARRRREGQAEGHERHRCNAPQRLLDDLQGECQHKAEDQSY
jgi:hypothetical protein